MSYSRRECNRLHSLVTNCTQVLLIAQLARNNTKLRGTHTYTTHASQAATDKEATSLAAEAVPLDEGSLQYGSARVQHKQYM